MTQAPPRAEKPGGEQEPKPARKISGARKLAEWVSLGLSVLLILSLAGFLTTRGLRSEPPFIAAEIRPRVEQARRLGERFVLPVELSNPSPRTLRNLRAEVEFTPEGGEPEKREIEIDYLGQGATQTVYLYLDEDPAGLRIEATPLSYRLD